MLSVGFFLSSSESETEEENYSRIRKEIRDHSNPLELPISTFIQLFRINKDAFKCLLGEIEVHLPERKRSTSIPPYLKLAVVLRFFAEGSYQKGVGQDFNIGMSQSTISTVLKEVLDVFERVICPKWISFNLTEEEKSHAKNCFFQKYGFPGVIGCVDGTHIKIITPSESEHLFYNRKGYHSINAMIICDHNMEIRAIDARYGGASHDAHVWELSDIRRDLSSNRMPRENSWLLGDSGYPLEPWIITPFRAASEGSREARFNSIHSKCRSIIERTIGLLKTRFRCVLSARELHYKPEKAVKIINSCCALHNICVKYNVEFNEDLITNEEEVFNDNYIHIDDSGNNEGRRIRTEILNSIC